MGGSGRKTSVTASEILECITSWLMDRADKDWEATDLENWMGQDAQETRVWFWISKILDIYLKS